MVPSALLPASLALLALVGCSGQGAVHHRHRCWTPGKQPQRPPRRSSQAPGALPEAWAFTLSLWVWRGVMLAWALWLTNGLVSWLKWAWREFSAVGVRKA
jgi:hypothetical protein